MPAWRQIRRRLARDAPSAVWHLMYYVCDVMYPRSMYVYTPLGDAGI